MARRNSSAGWIGGIGAVVLAVGAGLYFARTAPEATTTVPLPPGGPAAGGAAAPGASPSAAPQHPIEQAEADAADADLPPGPPPALEDSDRPAFDALAALGGGGEAFGTLVAPDHLIQRIVATVDGLTRPKLGQNVSPLRPAQGVFATRADGPQRVVAADNAARYDAYVRIARSVDAKKLVAWYVRAYPLFQRAYRDLGYPDGYFNDRLIAVIDHLLATPDPPQPLAVVRPNVQYEFADPALEARSAGQKALLRAGPANAAAVKAKLREIRALLAGQALPKG